MIHVDTLEHILDLKLITIKHGKGLSEDSHDSASMDMMDILKHIPEIKFIYVMYMVNNSMNSVCL